MDNFVFGLLKTDLESDIASCKEGIKLCVERATQYQENADEIKAFDPETANGQLFWVKHYQEQEVYYRQRLFKKRIELRQLVASW